LPFLRKGLLKKPIHTVAAGFATPKAACDLPRFNSLEIHLLLRSAASTTLKKVLLRRQEPFPDADGAGRGSCPRRKKQQPAPQVNIIVELINWY